MNPEITFTPLRGSGNANTQGHGFCSLLEIDDTTILLDCGASAALLSLSSSSSMDSKTRLKALDDFELFLEQIDSMSNTIDAILLSHGDFAHIGALPIICRRLKRPIKIYCTQPVLKMGQMVLYDAFINMTRSGMDIGTNIPDLVGERQQITFTLDDVDLCFSDVVQVKYNQEEELGSTLQDKENHVRICALPAGRTVGGTSWQVTSGVATILYAVGMNLKKETVLDGADLKLFPQSPSLLIVDCNCSHLIKPSSFLLTTTKKKKDMSSQDTLVAVIIEALRSRVGGNVLIPCESAGRALELMQVLARNVMDSKTRLEIDSLVYLSPMAHNILEFAKAQLEWMSESLCDSFYKGKSNPFEFTSNDRRPPLLRCATSLAELDRMGSGTKIVLATDSSLSTGFAKELLLLWGGDPKCKVIFTHEPDSLSLGAEILSQIDTPPVIVTVVKTEKVLLAGNELKEYLAKADREKKAIDEEALQKKRELELSMLVNPEDEADVEDDDDDDDDIDTEAPMTLVFGTPSRSTSNASNHGSGNKRSKLSAPVEGMAKFANPRHPQFVSSYEIESSLEAMEYGLGIADLNIPENIMTVKRTTRLSTVDTAGTSSKTSAVVASKSTGLRITQVATLPTKMVTKNVKLQLTCTFLYIPLDGKADLKAIKRIISEVNPQKVVVLRGRIEADVQSIIKRAKESCHEAYSPLNGEHINFIATGGVASIWLPHTMRTDGTRTVLDSGCQLRTVRANIRPDLSVDSEQSRRFSLIPIIDEQVNVEVEEEINGENVIENPLCLSSLDKRFRRTNALGRVSFGEVSLNSLKAKIGSKKIGAQEQPIQVDYRIGASGATVLCGNQLAIRKINDNDFIVEGTPGLLYNETREILYSNFSFF